MKFIQRTTKDIKNDFLKELLIDRGIIPKNDDEFQRQFFYPTEENLYDPMQLDNMKEGFELFDKHIKNGSNFFIVVDSDMDGFTSAATLYNYMTEVLARENPNFTINYHTPEGKEHGLDTIMNLFTKEKICDIIILPDSSSNDYEYHKILKDLGYDILVLDHHDAEKYSEDAIVINNQLSKNYENKALSGVGVVFKFLQYCDKQYGYSCANNYLDLVAMGECGDMMNLNTLENRYISNYGFRHINNAGLRGLVNQQSYSIFGSSDMIDWEHCRITPIQCAFYIAPLVNALIRVGTPSEKEMLFRSFIEGENAIESTKRGHKGEMESIAEQSARNCANARNRQNREKDKALDLLDIQIMNNCLDENKIIILNADDIDVSTTLTGLCAMGVAAKYKKPVILGRTSPDGYLKGSMRGQNDSELKDFKAFLIDSGLMDYVEGHAQAAGASLKVSNISKLYDYANEKLKDINFNEDFYEADFIVNGNCSYLGDMILNLSRGKHLYGQNCPEPVIIVQNITIDPKTITIMGKSKDTVKIIFNGISYLKFKATDLIDELAKHNGKVTLTVAGRGNVNEWGGKVNPQIFIDEIEIKDINEYDF